MTDKPTTDETAEAVSILKRTCARHATANKDAAAQALVDAVVHAAKEAGFKLAEPDSKAPKSVNYQSGDVRTILLPGNRAYTISLIPNRERGVLLEDAHGQPIEPQPALSFDPADGAFVSEEPFESRFYPAPGQRRDACVDALVIVAECIDKAFPVPK